MASAARITVVIGSPKAIYFQDSATHYLMKIVAYASKDGEVFMGMGDDQNEALSDLALRMFGNDDTSRLEART